MEGATFEEEAQLAALRAEQERKNQRILQNSHERNHLVRQIEMDVREVRRLNHHIQYLEKAIWKRREAPLWKEPAT